jgi:2-C-methyl-D-erythritol 4-phosphate cytidylyltransferase
VTPVESLKVGVAIPGAGRGERMGGVRKPFLEINGEPVLAHALRPFLADPRVVAIVVAVARDDAQSPPEWLTEIDPRVRVVAGGPSRAESVSLAIAALPADLDVIAVHDAARPLVRSEVVSQCLDVAGTGVGAVAGYPAVDTIKSVGQDGFISDTPDRSVLWHAHTPQAFPAEVLRKAYAAGVSGTDDSSLVERIGGSVRMIDGGADNLKVTRPVDIGIAEAILSARAARG